ncbi:tetratricopeptide repeat protein [Maribacter sp. ACAM166]|uniref:tetratricopeptide repeat protein n=1 Tax=Maribacter sp. ACAM166 TaxID=2508996 RepID=UPI0010FF59B5|nr:hypothetical protein [Maribacter sp. ACAM166]TLP80793.1 hypothetical protein ES765_06985 [Maribacter sp. ACAM166]
MKKLFFLMIFIVECISLKPIYAQVEQETDIEQSAEVFLEEYSDAFQENFFEGLKQKGIQNYDRAITYFLTCRRLQPENMVVAFELAKSNLLEKELTLAQEYAVEAVNGEPLNYWYAKTLSDVVVARKTGLEDVIEDVPWSNPVLRRNMAKIYFLNGNYQTALKILKGLKEPKEYAFLEKRILDSIAKQEANKQILSVPERLEQSEDLSSVEQFKTSLSKLLDGNGAVAILFELSEEAIENFPTQPYFYYANGAALNRLQKYKDAIELLETALDYLIDDLELENSIYKELANAYTAINNTSKANMYLSKIKPGF